MSKYSEFASGGTTRRYKKNTYITDPSEEIVKSFYRMRRTIGILGIILPVVLVMGSFSHWEPILSSMSLYYYSILGTLFTGILISIAMFLFHYSGTSTIEKAITVFAAIALFCVAFFPTGIDEKHAIKVCENLCESDFQEFVRPFIKYPKYVEQLHFGMASLFFILLTLLVLIFFIRSERQQDNLRSRIILYIICGIGMAASILACILIPMIFKNYKGWSFPTVFVCEFIALWFFGVAWLSKGEADEVVMKIMSRFHL